MHKILLLPLVSVAAMGQAAAPSASQPMSPSAGPPAPHFSINCADWTKMPDGNWSSNARGTLDYPNDIGSFQNNSFPQGQMIMDGIDLWQVVEDKCRKPGP